MVATAKLELSGVKKRFGRKVVLDGVDLAIQPKQSMVVIGGSGSGKSVLLKCVLGLLRPEDGSIRVDGEETAGHKGAERRRVLRKFGMLFQGAALFDSLTVWRNVAFGLIEGERMDPSEAKRIALEKLRRVGLGAEVGELSPAELSGGMKKRVALARAIAAEPEIIFFDEPTTGLDPIMGDVINRLIVECVEELGATTLTITHDMASVRAIADRVAMLHKGRIVWEGPVEAIDSSGSDYVDQFVHGRAEGPIQMEVR